METRALIGEALDLLNDELRPHIDKIFMTKELLLDSDGEFTNLTDFESFQSGLYNVMTDVTEAYERVYEQIELQCGDKTEKTQPLI